MNWPEVHAQLLGPTKQKMKGLEDLQVCAVAEEAEGRQCAVTGSKGQGAWWPCPQALVQTNFRLSTDELHELVDVTADLLADNNHKICQGTLAVLTFLVDQHADPIKPYTGILVPLVVSSCPLASTRTRLLAGTSARRHSTRHSGKATAVQAGLDSDRQTESPRLAAHSLCPPCRALQVERLGDAHQAVRLEASGLLLSMMSHLPLGTLMEKMSRGYSHRAWKVKHGVLQTLAEAISTNILDLRSHSNLKDHIITSAVNLLEDKNE